MKKLPLFLSAIIILFATSIFIQSCSNDEVENTRFANAKFLDIDLNKVTHLTIEQIKIIEEANKRSESYLKIQNNRYVLNLKSGEQINISDRLFTEMVTTLNATNAKIDTGELIFIGNKLVRTSDVSIDKGILRIKRAGENTGYNGPNSTIEYGPWGYTETISFNQLGAYAYYNQQVNNSSVITTIAGVAATVAGYSASPTASALFSLVSIAYGWTYAEVVCEQIWKAAQTGGIVVRVVVSYGRSSTFVFDARGNGICSF